LLGCAAPLLDGVLGAGLQRRYWHRCCIQCLAADTIVLSTCCAAGSCSRSHRVSGRKHQCANSVA
jgi:hypothetical protein